MINSFLPYIKFLPEFILALVMSLLITPIIGVIAKSTNLVDLPGNKRKPDDTTAWRRIHTETKLKLGGASVIVTFLLLTLIYVPQTKYLWGLISGVILLSICGVLDDIFDLSGKVQSIFHITAGFLVVLSGLQIETISSPIGHAISLTFMQVTIHHAVRYVPAALVTIFWIFFIINAVKWVAGSDGLVEGNGAITALIIGLLSVRFQTYPTALMGFVLSGAMLGLLYYNFYPSKILSGSTGKSVYGFILAVLAIYSGGKLATFVLTLSLPIIDAIWVISYRIIKYHPKTPFQLFSINDKSHIHHKLLDLGFSQKQVAYIEYIFTLTVGSLAFLLTGMHKALAIFIVAIVLILFYASLQIYLKRRNTSQSTSQLSGN